MKKLWISLTLLAILVLAFAGLANAEGMQDTVPGRPSFHVFGYNESGEIPVNGQITLEQIYAEDAKGYRVVISRADGTEYISESVEPNTWSIGYTLSECGEYSVNVYAYTWPDGVATPTDLLPQWAVATATDLQPATPTDLTACESTAGDPVYIHVKSMGPVLPGENPQIISGNVPTEVVQGEPIELTINWGNKATGAFAHIYSVNESESGEEERNYLVYGSASWGESITLSTWQLTPGETYKADVILSAVGFDNVKQTIEFTVISGQGETIDGWQWTLKEDLTCQLDSAVTVGVYYPGADSVRLIEYINGEEYTSFNGYKSEDAFLKVNTSTSGVFTFKAEAEIVSDDNNTVTTEAFCSYKITIGEGRLIPDLKMFSDPMQKIGEDVIIRVGIADPEEDTDYSTIQYDVSVQYGPGYNAYTIHNQTVNGSSAEIRIPWPELEDYGIGENESLYVNVYTHGLGFYPKWRGYNIYLIGTEDENFTISKVGANENVFRNEQYTICVENAPANISEIEILNENTWRAYTLAESGTTICEMQGIRSHDITPVVARYRTGEEEYRYSNILLLTPIGRGTLTAPVVSTNLDEEAGEVKSIGRGESIKIRLDNLNDYQVPVRLHACIEKLTGNPYWTYGDTSCDIQDENTVLRISTGMLPADSDNYILKVWSSDRNDKWDQSLETEIPFSLTAGIEQGEIKIMASSGDRETEGDSPLRVMTGESFIVSVYAPGASRTILYAGAYNETYPQVEANGSYVESFEMDPYAITVHYFANIYFPGEDEPIRSKTVTVQVTASSGYLTEHLKAYIPAIVTPGESFDIGLHSVDDESDLCPDELSISVEDQRNNIIWDGFVNDALTVTVPGKDMNGNNLLTNGRKYIVHIQAFKKGYDALWGSGYFYAVDPERQQQGLLTINGVSDQIDLLTVENYTVSVTGLPENVTAVGIMDPIRSTDWTYYVITDGETAVSYDNITHTLMQDTPFCARFTTQTIAENQNWDKVDWEGYTNTVDVSVTTRGPLPTPVVSTNLTETVENEEIKRSVEKGDAIVITLNNQDEYIVTDNAYISGTVLRVVNEYEEQMELSYGSQISSENNQLKIPTGRLPAHTDDYILRLQINDHSGKWDQSVAIDIPFSVVISTQIGEARISATATEIITGDWYNIYAFAPGAEWVEICCGDYRNYYTASQNWDDYCELSSISHCDDTYQYFARAHYHDIEEPVQSDIITVRIINLYGYLKDKIKVKVPTIVISNEPFDITIESLDEGNELIPDEFYLDIYSDGNYIWSTFVNGSPSVTVPVGLLQSGKQYYASGSVYKKGYCQTGFGGPFYVVEAGTQQGTLTVNNENEQVELLAGESYTATITGLPEGVTAVCVLRTGGGWAFYPLSYGSSSITITDSASSPVITNIFARYTMQSIDENIDWWNQDIDWNGYTNSVGVTVVSKGSLPTPVISTNLTELIENDDKKHGIEMGDGLVVTLENPEAYAEMSNVHLYGCVLSSSDGHELLSSESFISGNNNQLHLSTSCLPMQADDYILRVWMYDFSSLWDQSTIIDIPFSVTVNTQEGGIRITSSATELLTGETYFIDVFAPGAEHVEIYSGDYTSNYLYSDSWNSSAFLSNQSNDAQVYQYFAQAYYQNENEPVRSEIVTIQVLAPYGYLRNYVDYIIPTFVVPGEPLTIGLQNMNDNGGLTPDEVYVNIYEWDTNYNYSVSNYGPDYDFTIPTDDWQSGRNYRVEVSAFKKGYNAYWANKTVYVFSPDVQQGDLAINNEDEQIELLTGDSYTISVTGLPEGITAVGVLIPGRSGEWSYHTIEDGATSLSISDVINYPVTHQQVFARYTTQMIDEYQDWSAITWTGYTNLVDVTATCTHNETYTRYEWDENSICTADDNDTHTYTGHGEKWKVCSCCGEKLELLEEVTSLTEGHSYSDGICYECGYECTHDPEDIIHEKYLNGDRTYIDEYVHHVSGIYVEHDYCGHCGKWIGETTETPVDQDENHHYDEWYYCNECYYQSTENHYLNVTCDWEYGDALVALHGDKTLSITNAESDLSDTITYQWYLYDRDGRSILIDGATGPYYVVEDIVNRTEGYVHISDGYTYRNRSFVINIDNGFTAYAENYQNDLTVQPNETATMNVVANCNYGELTYQWYEFNSEVEGSWYTCADATGASYTSEAITGYKQYYCNVRDEYGNSSDVWFYIHVDNGLTAYAENYQNDLTVQPGETATMNVVAGCNSGELTYQWYEYIEYEEEGYWNTRYEVIADATGASYTSEAITGYKPYYCTVRDEYGNSSDVWFYIHIDNNLSIVQVGEQIRYIEPGEEVTLEVNATCSAGEITYQWYEYAYDIDGQYWLSETTLQGATSNIYTTDGLYARKRYECRVYDEYGNSNSVSFDINIDNGLTAAALNNRYHFTVYAGESLTLNTVASCDNGQVYYQWYGDGREKIENATGSSYTTEALYGYKEYICCVYDDYGNWTETAWFTVSIDSGLTAEPAGAYVYHVSQEPITLAVNASNLLPELQIGYTWYDEYGNWLDYTTSGTYTLTNPSTGSYYCDVSDGSQNRRVWFYVVDGVLAQACGNNDYGVRPNEPVTLRVAAWNAQNDITYQWFENDGTAIDGATESVLSFNADHNKDVYCHVEGTGINTDIPFRVYIATSFELGSESINKVCLIPSGESIQIIRNITSTYDNDLAISWFRNGEEIPGEASNTLTVTAGGYYVFKAEDCYGNIYEYSFWCVEGQPETVSEWDTVYRNANTTDKIYQFIPSEDGIYQLEGSCEICKAGTEGIFISLQWPDIIRLEAGQIYYAVLDHSNSSFRYGMIQKDREDYNITLPRGQNFWIPDLVINACGYSVDNSISDNQAVVYNDGYYFETLSTGTANLTITYGCQVQRVYHITVIDANIITLPEQLHTIEEDAFNGDIGMRFIRLGGNVQTVKSGAFANTGDITIIVENGNTVFESGAFSNANPLIICQNGSSVAWYCNGNRIPYLTQ